MYSEEKEVSIKIQSRPLKIVYLIKGKEDLIDAVSLYTHIWGGRVNAIFPIPTDEEEITRLAMSLYHLRPDYIFLPYGEYKEVPNHLWRILKNFPCGKWLVSSERIKNHNTGLPFLEFNMGYLSNGYLSHINPLLEASYPSKLISRNIRSVKQNGQFNFELMLLTGLPSEYYTKYLDDHLAMQYFPVPLTLKDLIKTTILLHEQITPLELTDIETRSESYNLMTLYKRSEALINRTFDATIFEIFIDEDGCIDAAIAYWNSKKMSNKKRLYLSKELFLQEMESTITLILQIMPYIERVWLITSLTQEKAHELLTQTKQVVSKLKQSLLVNISYRDYKYDLIEPGLLWWEPEEIRSFIANDRGVSFKPSTPFGHINSKFAFGFNAEIKFISSGTRFSLPIAEKTNILLTNEIERVERWESEENNLWLHRKSSIWPLEGGISGTTIPGEDCKIFIHSSNTIISYYIKSAGFIIKPNPHTKYAQGFIKRFGCFSDTVDLIRKNGISILYGLGSPKAEQCGLQYAEIYGFIRQYLKISEQEAKNITKEKLPQLLLSGSVRRGFALKCPNCDLKEWYAIEQLREQIQCIGCAELFQLDLSNSHYYFKINELAKRLLASGGQAVLMTAAAFHNLDNAGFIEFGGDLSKSTEKGNFAEVDLLWLTHSCLIIAECKDYKHTTEDRIETVRDSFEKTIEAAKIMGAQIVFLGITTNADPTPLHNLVQEFAAKNKEHKLGVHLILNGDIYPFGQNKPLQEHLMHIDYLRVFKSKTNSQRVIGDPLYMIHGYLLNRIYKEDILKQWERELTNEKREFYPNFE